jgi:arginine exporter protein ArgO
MTDDQTQTGSEQSAPADDVQAARAANRFDIRRLIGSLFAVYGIILVILGLAGSHAIKHKADNIDIDLWTGIAMLLFAAFMIAWALWRPTVPKPEAAGSDA